MTRTGASACLVAAALLGRALAVMPDRASSGDAARFGLDRPEPARRPSPAPVSRAALGRSRAMSHGTARVRYQPQTGRISGLRGSLSGPDRGGPQEAAAAFLRDNRDVLGIDPARLRLNAARKAGPLTHLLYGQVHEGVPVEFSGVKFHVSEDGVVEGFDSSFLHDIRDPPAPAIGAIQAALSVARELGGGAPGGGGLVYVPVHRTGEVRLAWKFRASVARGLWVYYVDAKTGEVLFRYNDLRFAACGALSGNTCGAVYGQVYDVDPSSTPLTARAFPNQNVTVYGVSAPATTGSDGCFCSPASGKIVAGLQGPYVNVAHFNLPPAHYDNGGGAWFTAATPLSSPHPYPDGSGVPNGEVFSGLIESAGVPVPVPGGSRIVKVLPRFSSFQVGSVSGEGEILDDDQARLEDANGYLLASYLGDKGSFRGAAAQGLDPSLRLRLLANSSGRQPGFDVDVSSFLVLTGAFAVSAADSGFTWGPSMTSDGGQDEINVFYQISKMHDYLMADVNRSSAAPISVPVAAMTHAGPNLLNAFYNPDHNTISLGDALPFALDATVIRHEYVHFVIDKIYPILNFGQHGAISEAMADYFAASSLEMPSIGRFVAAALSPESSLRELRCDPVTQSPACRLFPGQWSGEIHNDSLPLSQALWEIRESAGRACADELAFQSLFFFPDSFQEFADAMLQVDARSPGLAPACGAAGSKQALLLARFAAHGIPVCDFGAGCAGDAFEPNDGTQSATDVTTRPVISATIFPAADLDFYTFGSGAGLIEAELQLPPNGPGAYVAYGLLLLDRQLNVLAEAIPPLDVNPTFDGGCPGGLSPGDACLTSSAKVLLRYNNPSENALYLLVQAGPGDAGSNSGTNSAVPYALRVDYPRAGALSAALISASFDNDVVSFSVFASTFVRFQNVSFNHAQLRDQAFGVLPQTRTDGASPYLTLLSSTAAGGRISGVLRLAPGFAARFPSVGTVYLEVFGANALQAAKRDDGNPSSLAYPQTLGFSNPIHLTGRGNALSAWNNVFNPRRGEKATFKYELAGSGHVSLRLYTLNGHLVSTLVDEDSPSGKGSVDWHGTNASGSTVASGIYLLHLDGPGVRMTRKVVVVK